MLRVLACEPSVNNAFLNPTSALQVNSKDFQNFDSNFYQKILTILKDTFQQATLEINQNNFASLSIIMDIFSNVLSKRTAHRNMASNLAIFDYFQQLYSLVTAPPLVPSSADQNTQTTPGTGFALVQYMTTAANGHKLITSFYRLAHNVMGIGARIGSQVHDSAVNDNSRLVAAISQSNGQWLKYSTHLLVTLSGAKIRTDEPWEQTSPLYDVLLNFVHALGFHCDVYGDVKEYFVKRYPKFLGEFLPKCLAFFIKNVAKSKLEQNLGAIFLRDVNILFVAKA
jgi:hypothetical protein